MIGLILLTVIGLGVSKVHTTDVGHVLGSICFMQFLAITLAAVGRRARFVIGSITMMVLLTALAWNFEWNSEFYRTEAFGCFVLAMLVFVVVIVVAQFVWGIRVVQLFESVTEIELETRTGKSWNQWQQHLDDCGGSEMLYSEIAAELRTFGIENDLIKVTTTAYLRSCGRSDTDYMPPSSRAGSLAVLVPRFRRGEGVENTRQFSIGQLLIVTVVAAGLFRIAVALDIKLAEADVLFALISLTSTLAGIALLVIWTRLAARPEGKKTLLTWGISLGLVLLAAPLLLIQVPEEGVVFHLVGFALWMILGTSLVRGKGYRALSFQRCLGTKIRGATAPQAEKTGNDA